MGWTTERGSYQVIVASVIAVRPGMKHRRKVGGHCYAMYLGRHRRAARRVQACRQQGNQLSSIQKDVEPEEGTEEWLREREREVRE